MQESRIRDQAQPTPIEVCIKEIEDCKTFIKKQFQKKIISTIERAERTFHIKINEACMASIDCLTRLNNTELHYLEIEKYVYKTNKLAEYLRNIDIGSEIKGVAASIKASVDVLKKVRLLEELPQIVNANNSLMKLERTLKVEGEPITSLQIINKKLMQVKDHSVTIERNSISKKFDLLLPVRLPGKDKQILFTLYDSTLGIYNDKLVLHSFRPLQYRVSEEEPLKATQIGNYVLIAERHRIMRISLSNLNQIYTRAFPQEVTALGAHLLGGMVQVGLADLEGQRLALLDLEELDCIASVPQPARVRHLATDLNSSMLMVATDQGCKLYSRGLNELNLPTNASALRVLASKPLHNKLIVVVGELQIMCLGYEQSGQVSIQKLNNTLTKGVRNVAFNEYQVYAMAGSGGKIYVHTF